MLMWHGGFRGWKWTLGEVGFRQVKRRLPESGREATFGGSNIPYLINVFYFRSYHIIGYYMQLFIELIETT